MNNTNEKAILNFWKKFLLKKNINTNTAVPQSFCFGDSEELANSLLNLVMIGKKTATSSSFPAYEIYKEEPPKTNDCSIITDWEGTPKCIVQNKKVSIISFKDIDFKLVSKEGEDKTLKSWQKNHKEFFIEDGKILGYTFDENMLIVFEEFEIIFKDNN